MSEQKERIRVGKTVLLVEDIRSWTKLESGGITVMHGHGFLGPHAATCPPEKAAELEAFLAKSLPFTVDFSHPKENT